MAEKEVIQDPSTGKEVVHDPYDAHNEKVAMSPADSDGPDGAAGGRRRSVVGNNIVYNPLQVSLNPSSAYIPQVRVHVAMFEIRHNPINRTRIHSGRSH
jgi:hypothetical protein